MNTKIAQRCLHHLIFFVISLSFSCLSLETDTITSSIILRDPDTIVSSKQVFKLGFFSPPNTTNRYLGVFYAFSEETVVWVANRDTPLSDSSSTVTISNDGNLVLINSSNQTVWSTNLTTTSPVNATLQIVDTGNLLLRNVATGNTTWESFSYPTDVFLPTMRLSYNLRTGKRVSITAWKNATDPGIGSFTAGIDDALSVPQTIILNNGRTHWRSGPWNGQIFIGVRDMYAAASDGIMGVRNESDGTFYYTVPQRSFFSQLALNSSGTMVETIWSDQTRTWNRAYTAPKTTCDVYERCGPFGSCNIQDTPICSCLRGFEPANGEEWETGNWTSGCRRRNQLQCDRSGGSGTRDGFFRLQSMKVPEFAQFLSTRQEGECRSRCLGNCSCIAYAQERNLGCMLWSDTLIDAQEFNGVGVDLYIRLSTLDLDKDKDRKLYYIIPVVVGSVCITIFIFVAWRLIAKRKGDETKDKNINEAGQKLPSDAVAIALKDEFKKVNIEELPLFTFEMLANATDQFQESNLLGRGGFGPVYKGILEKGKEIAVKRLSAASGQGMEQFMNEVILISKVQHKNLVRLLGCCVEKEEKMLVYEYMPNKSLDVCLFDPTHPSQKVLDWTKRFSIIEGIGRGLLYLHRDSRLRIIHRDLKPSNVLLDEDWNPKISDFGMARIFGGNQDHGNTARIVGTYGYMAPEYAMEGRFSEKSDVYSFGVLMLEIVKGKKNVNYYNHDWSLSLLGFAWKLWSEDNGFAFADESIASPNVEPEIVRCIQIALLCVQDFPKHRPTIETVVSMLSREIVDLPTPEQPVFAEKWDGKTVGSTQLNNHVGYSVNELTVTVLDGR